MSIDDGLAAMRAPIARGEWEALERSHGETCAAADPASAAAIASVDLAGYQSLLRDRLRSAVHASDPSVAAVYWEFDVDNAWESAFFLCHEYLPEESHDDGWAASFDESKVVRGPSMPRLAALRAGTWSARDADTSRSLYLIARTIAALGRAAQGWPLSIPLCAGFHDQDIVFRIAPPGDIAARWVITTPCRLSLVKELGMRFQVGVSSPPDRDGLVADVFVDDVQVAELRYESGVVIVEIYPRPDRRPWTVPYAEIVGALGSAHARLATFYPVDRPN